MELNKAEKFFIKEAMMLVDEKYEKIREQKINDAKQWKLLNIKRVRKPKAETMEA